MPNCFQLVRKAKPEEGPVRLVLIDEELCNHFKVDCDPVKWFHGWYDFIGYGLAAGKSFAEIRTICTDLVSNKDDADGKMHWQRMVEIADYLNEHFTSDAWYDPIRNRK